MTHTGPRLGTGQRSAAGVAKQVQNADGAARRLDLFLIPRPVYGLLGEYTRVLKAGGADHQIQIIPADLPFLGQTAAVFPFAAALDRAVIHGIRLVPQIAHGLVFPHHLRVRAHQQGAAPALKSVAAGGIDEFIVFPLICRAHSRFSSLYPFYRLIFSVFPRDQRSKRLCWPFSSGACPRVGSSGGGVRPKCP